MLEGKPFVELSTGMPDRKACMKYVQCHESKELDHDNEQPCNSMALASDGIFAEEGQR